VRPSVRNTAAVAGFGLAQVPDLMAEGELRAGPLVEVLKAYRAPPPLPNSLVYPKSRQITPRLRALIDALTGESSSSDLARRIRNRQRAEASADGGPNPRGSDP
jgi:DNA-binding transcriptional LysR family regulator